MRLVIHTHKCQGVGLCEAVAPELFEVADEGFVVLHQDEIPEQLEDRARQAASGCPTETIEVVS